MRLSDVLSKRAIVIVDLLAAHGFAHIHGPLLLDLMYGLMLFQIWPRCKRLSTLSAHVGTVSSVDALVSDKVTDLCERFAASIEFADIRVFVVVDTLVLLETWILDEGRTAFLAITINLNSIDDLPLVWLLSGVCPHVLS